MERGWTLESCGTRRFSICTRPPIRLGSYRATYNQTLLKWLLRSTVWWLRCLRGMMPWSTSCSRVLRCWSLNCRTDMWENVSKQEIQRLFDSSVAEGGISRQNKYICMYIFCIFGVNTVWNIKSTKPSSNKSSAGSELQQGTIKSNQWAQAEEVTANPLPRSLPSSLTPICLLTFATFCYEKHFLIQEVKPSKV